MTENEIAAIIVDSAYKVHVTLGPGLLESVYSGAMTHELRKRGLKVTVEQSIPVTYDGIPLGEGFRVDLIVEEKVIIELKSVERILPLHAKQLLTYLRLADKHLGLPINFNVPLIKQGVSRIVNSLKE